MQNKKQQIQQQQSNPKAKWLEYSQAQDKTSADYINMITSDDSYTKDFGITRLEAMVREQLKREIPNVEGMKSYENLVSAVMNNYMKKQLQATD